MEQITCLSNPTLYANPHVTGSLIGAPLLLFLFPLSPCGTPWMPQTMNHKHVTALTPSVQCSASASRTARTHSQSRPSIQKPVETYSMAREREHAST